MNKTKDFKKLAKLFFVSLSLSGIITICTLSLIYITLVTDEKGMTAFSPSAKNLVPYKNGFQLDLSHLLRDKRDFIL